MAKEGFVMIEAWQIQHKPFLYAVLRRFELTRWAFRRKMFGSQLARLRAVLLILCGHETEICSECGRGVNCVWWCDDSALWERVTSWKGGGGVCCPRCFERMAERQGVSLRWRVGLL
jgi:hypothetical protein